MEEQKFDLFNKLKELQSLIKKEASLKQLCMYIVNYNIFKYIF